MEKKPKQEIHYKKTVWVNPTTDPLRRKECLCLNCDKLNDDRPEDCATAQALYDLSVLYNIALMVTRCVAWRG